MESHLAIMQTTHPTLPPPLETDVLRLKQVELDPLEQEEDLPKHQIAAWTLI